MIELTNKILQGNCLEVLKTLPDNSIDCCVTSPPYFGLRDYGTANWEGGNPDCDHKRVPETSIEKSRSTSTIGYAENTGHSLDTVYKDVCAKCGAKRIDSQIGLEKTPELFVEKMVSVFEEVKRILKSEGTLWLNLGDSYNGYPANVTRGGEISGANQHARQFKESGYGLACKSLKPKDLIGIPWMVAFALRSSGWYLRQDIIWHKPNPMPESVTDRCTKSHEYIFLMSKSAKYYYDADAIKTSLKDTSLARLGQNIESQTGSDRVPGKTNGKMKAVKFGGNKAEGYGTRIHSGKEWKPKGYEHRGTGDQKLTGHSGNFDSDGNLIGDGMANKKSVWTVTTKPFSEAHFATFPQDLIVDCIKAGCPENGIILDPFMGAGTTALVARKLNRNFLGIELNEEYIKIAEKRLVSELGMFK
jgi:DNA modification methylase